MFMIMESSASKTILNMATVLRIKSFRDIFPYIDTEEQILDIVSNYTTLIAPLRIPSKI
jgi:hypothetical protein